MSAPKTGIKGSVSTAISADKGSKTNSVAITTAGTTMEKNKAVMLELEQKMVKYQQLYTLENPSVYLATIKDSRNAEAPTNSLTAKTFWPMMNGRRKEIRIYIGKESEYPDHKKIHVRILAKQKMKETLLERYNNGELK